MVGEKNKRSKTSAFALTEKETADNEDMLKSCLESENSADVKLKAGRGIFFGVIQSKPRRANSNNTVEMRRKAIDPVVQGSSLKLLISAQAVKSEQVLAALSNESAAAR